MQGGLWVSRAPTVERGRRAAGVFVLASMLAACASAPPPAAELPAAPHRYAALADAHGKAQPARDDAPFAPSPPRWWQVFDDPQLDALITRAEQHNTRIALAVARVAQARALLRGSQAAAMPQVALSTSGSRQGGPLVNAAGSSGTLINAGAGLSYEVDLFGRLSAGRQAAALDLQARDADAQAMRLMVQAEVVQTWLALRTLQAEHDAATRAAQSWADTLALNEQRLRRGSVAEVALLRLRAEATEADADLAALGQRRAELQHTLAVLVGELPSDFITPQHAASPPALPQIPAGLPSRMLERRPDLAAAQHQYAAAQARRGEARAAGWPTLALTGSGGHASSALGQLLQASTRAWGVGLLASLPLFDGGRREADVQQADAQADADFANLRAVFLNALREVEDQLSALDSVGRQAALQAQASQAQHEALRAVESRQRNGLASQLDTLEARRTAMRSERRLLQLQATQAQLTVGLIRVLGGGWDAS